MDVSNASGYDGTTVAADACFVAKHATGRHEDRRHRGDEPAGAPGREDVRAGLRARGRRGAAPRRHDRPRRACGRRPRDAAAVIFQQPNFFGCLEPAPDLAAAANDAEALADRARRPDVARRARGAGQLRLRDRDRRGPGRRQLPVSFGGPHYGFLAARAGVHPPDARADRRRDGRRRGRARLCPHPADARAAHPPREGDVEHHHEPDAARARRASSTSRWLGPAGAARAGGDLPGARGVREGAARGARGARAGVSGTGNVQGVRRPRRTERAARSIAAAREQGSIPATRSAATTRAWTTRCSSPSPRSGRRPRSTGSRRCSPRCRHEADLREVAGRAAARSAIPQPRTCRRPRFPPSCARSEPPRLPEVAEPELLRHFTELSTRNFGIDTGFYPLGSCTMKYNPRVNERLVGAARVPRPASAARTRTARRARSSSMWRLQEILARGRRASTPSRCSRRPARRAS